MFYKTLFPIIKNHLSTIIGSILDMQLILIADTDDFLRCSVVTDHQIHRGERSVLALDGPYLLQRSVGERLFRYPYLDDASQPLLVKELEVLHVGLAGHVIRVAPDKEASRDLLVGDFLLDQFVGPVIAYPAANADISNLCAKLVYVSLTFLEGHVLDRDILR